MSTHLVPQPPSITRIPWLLIALIVLICGGIAAVAFLSRPQRGFVDTSEKLPLAAIPGITDYALADKNVTYRINEPVSYYKTDGVAFFEVEVLAPGFAQPNLTFVGDGERFNKFVAEVNFVNANAARFKVGQTGQGALDGVTSLVTGLWGLVRHPINSVVGIGSGAVELSKYLYKAFIGKVDPTVDIKNLANAVYLNTASEVAEDAHFSYQEAITQEARDTANAMTNWKLSGRGVTEVALLLVPFSKFSAVKTAAEVGEVAKGAAVLKDAEEIGEVAKGYENLLKGGELFSQAEKISASLQRLERFNTLETKLADQILRYLTDPQKLASLGIRKANPRIHQLLYHLYELENNGGKVAEALDLSLMPGEQGEFYYSQSLVKRQILENFARAKEYGVFDDASNLEKMRHGKPPTITRGLYAGRPVDVDHIIPLKVAPELDNNLANLRYLSEPENAAKGASMDGDSMKLANAMKLVGWKPPASLQAEAIVR